MTTVFSSFCEIFRHHTGAEKSQAQFVASILSASGSNFFPLKVDSKCAYPRMLFTGLREISAAIKDSFVNGFNAEGLFNLLKKYVGTAKKQFGTPQEICTKIANDFGLKVDSIDTNVFLWALTDCYKVLLTSPNDIKVSDIQSFYVERLHGNTTPRLPVPLYKGDNVDLKIVAAKVPSCGFWQNIDHEWVFRNSGEVSWRGRKLVCTNPDDLVIRPLKQTEIEIPDSSPSQQYISLKVVLRAQGEQRQGTSHWQMVDDKGRDCFPNRQSAFDLTINVDF